jgi:hypothetical protein
MDMHLQVSNEERSLLQNAYRPMIKTVATGKHAGVSS